MLIANFITDSNKAGSMDKLAALFASLVKKIGFEFFCTYTVNGPTQEDADSAYYPKDFVEKYRDQKWINQDPIFKLFCRTREPFIWEQINALPLTPKQKEIMAVRKKFKLCNGISIPVQSADPKVIGMSIETESDIIKSDANVIGQVYAAGNQFQLQRARILGQNSILELPEINLTPREREMLEWAAHGKSNSIIAEILGISEKTVEFHFKSIFNKLEVSNRTTAALKAVQLRLINI